MAFTCGFYNSENHDRTYDAIQFGSIFDGVIQDGVFEHYEKCFLLKDTGGVGNNTVIIQPGRAWFNHTWIYNDADFALEDMPIPELVLERIDAVVIRVNHNARENTIEIIQGTPASTPTKPEIVNHGPDIWDYPLAYITRHADNPKITQADIENAVGTSECPFSTGLIEGITTDQLVAQWSAQWAVWSRDQRAAFMEWYNNLQYVLDGDVAGHLQNEIDDLKNAIENIFYVEYDNDLSGPASRYYGPGSYIYFPDLDELYLTLTNISEGDQFFDRAHFPQDPNVALSEEPISEVMVSQVNRTLSDVADELTANGNRMYMDYQNGKYGVNTSPERGADTFFPFNDVQPIYDAIVARGVIPDSDSVEDLVAAIAKVDTKHTVGASAIYKGSGSGVRLRMYVDGRLVNEQTNQDPSYSVTV